MQLVKETPTTRGQEPRAGTANDTFGERHGRSAASGNLDALRACLRELTASYEAETRQLLNRIIALEADEKRRSDSGTMTERS